MIKYSGIEFKKIYGDSFAILVNKHNSNIKLIKDQITTKPINYIKRMEKYEGGYFIVKTSEINEWIDMYKTFSTDIDYFHMVSITDDAIVLVDDNKFQVDKLFILS
jgi:hypothetical protein